MLVLGAIPALCVWMAMSMSVRAETVAVGRELPA